MCSIGNHTWSVARLFQLTKNFPVMVVQLDHLNVYQKYNNLTLRDMVTHMNAVNAADLNLPIILDEDGELMDGRHRLMKAMMIGEKTIKVVRFDENPIPCSVKSD